MELERDVERYLKERVKRIGGICWKFVSPGTAGVPDRIVLYKGKASFVELKKQGGFLSKMQKVRIYQLQEQGIPVCVLNSKTAVDGFIKGLQYGIQTP